MAITGIPKIDQLLAGGGVPPLGPDNTDVATVGLIQDLLIGQGFKGLPGPLASARGKFGPKTQQAVRDFQQNQGLPVTGTIDIATLNRLVDTPATRPLACCGYLTLVLDVAFAGMVRVMSLTSQFEGAGLFIAMNRNTDKAGLSFGLIQWAQKPRRLNELLRAFQAGDPDLFVQIFGAAIDEIFIDARFRREAIILAVERLHPAHGLGARRLRALNDAEVNEHISQAALRDAMHGRGDDLVASHFSSDDSLTLPFRLNGQEAELNYRRHSGEIDFHRTYVPEVFRGRGFAERLGDAAFAYAKAEGLRVIPTCSYIAGAYLKRHPEHETLILRPGAAPGPSAAH